MAVDNWYNIMVQLVELQLVDRSLDGFFEKLGSLYIPFIMLYGLDFNIYATSHVTLHPTSHVTPRTRFVK